VEDDDDLSSVAGVERAARDLEFDYVHGFAERYQWDPDRVRALTWDDVRAFSDRFDRDRVEDEVDHWRQVAGGDGNEPPPENPDAAYYKRKAAMRALMQAQAQRN
jgi:hypothetical protein